MPPKSPTQAFDPTPALEHDQDNYSPLNDPREREDSLERTNREVHFSDIPTILPTGARHSIATTNVPLLPAVSSASQIPKQSFRVTNPGPGLDINAYFENCRNLNEQLRQAHETERRAWNIERIALQARIAELEFKVNKARDPKRRSSNDSSSASMQSFRSDLRSMHSAMPVNGVKMASDTAVPTVPSSWVPSAPRTSSDSATSDAAPVWRRPESTHHVTRVFSNEDNQEHLPSISEDETFPALSQEISPTSGHDRQDSIPVPVEQVDSSLDGITLRSTALTSSFITKITSPQFGSPARSPSPRPKNASEGSSLQVEIGKFLSPLDEKLKRHAGHTPMAFDGAASTGQTSVEVTTPKQEGPLAPAPTTRPPLRPSEKSDSYFSFSSQNPGMEEREETIPEEVEPEPQFEAEDDAPMKGPLMLDHRATTSAANEFLEKVDAKLLQAAQDSRRDSVLSDSSDDPSKPRGSMQHNRDVSEADNDMPRLRIRKSLNFGSAWGGDHPGRI